MNAIAKAFKDTIKIQLPNEKLASHLQQLLDDANLLPRKLSGKEYETLLLGLRDSIEMLLADTKRFADTPETIQDGIQKIKDGTRLAVESAQLLVTYLKTHRDLFRRRSITPSSANQVQKVLDRVRGISEKITDSAVGLYFGTAPRGTDYPHITFMPTSDVPLRIQDADPLSITHWDFKIWGSRAIDIGTIYTELMNIFNQDDLGNDDFIVTLRGRGLPMMTEVNRPNEIIYSRVVECEVIV